MEWGICISSNIDKRNLKIKVKRYGRFLGVFVILICLFVVYPLITSFVYIGTRFLGEPVSYLAGGIVGNLYVPLITVLGVMVLFIMVKFIYLNLFINKKLLNIEVKLSNLRFKEALVILILVMASVGLVFNSLIAEWNLIQDVPHLVDSNFAVEEGIITLYEVSHGDVSETLMKVNGIKMDGGIACKEELIDNAKYYVEYLPHSKYVVNYHRIP